MPIIYAYKYIIDLLLQENNKYTVDTKNGKKQEDLLAHT